MLKALQQGDIENRLHALEAVEASKSKNEKPTPTAKHDDPPAPVPTIYSRRTLPEDR
jgi:hypothetical protein